MTNSFRRDNPPLLIVSMKIFRTFFPARLENADKATSPIALAYRDGEKKSEYQKRWERLIMNRRQKNRQRLSKIKNENKGNSNTDDKKTD